MSKLVTNEDAPMREFEFRMNNGDVVRYQAQMVNEGPAAFTLLKYRGNMGYVVAAVTYKSFESFEATMPEAEELEELNKRIDAQMEEAKAKLVQKIDLSEMDDIFGKVN